MLIPGVCCYIHHRFDSCGTRWLRIFLSNYIVFIIFVISSINQSCWTNWPIRFRGRPLPVFFLFFFSLGGTPLNIQLLELVAGEESEAARRFSKYSNGPTGGGEMAVIAPHFFNINPELQRRLREVSGVRWLI